jgi:hypothetical protein
MDGRAEERWDIVSLREDNCYFATLENQQLWEYGVFT